MTYDEYVAFVATPENLARQATEGAARADRSGFLRDAYAAAKLEPQQVEALQWLAAQPEGPNKVLVIAEEWSSDCRRDLPMFQRIAEAIGGEMRIFTRDDVEWSGAPEPAASTTNADLMRQFVNRKAGGPFQSIPVAAFFTKDMKYLYHYTEYPAIYHKDRIVYGTIQKARPGESNEDRLARAGREFGELQNSAFFKVWACAGVDEIISSLHRVALMGTV
jgi:hypothetical protein